MASSTGEQIRQELRKYGLLRLLGQGTATAGGANRIRDTGRFSNTSMPATAFDGCWVRLSGGTNDGEIALVDYLDTANGDLYVTPSFSAAPTSSTTYEIWHAGIYPDDVDRARDEALTSVCSQWQRMPVSIVTNAAYLIDTTSWDAAADGAAPTLARQGGTFPTELWPATLLVTNASANGRAESLAITAVRASDYFYLYVPVSVRAGTARVIVRDITNGANISLNGTVAETRRGWSGIEVTGQIPATCDSIEIWLRGDEATAVVEWGPVFFTPQEFRTIQLPARLDSKEKVGPVYELTRYPTATGQGYWGENARRELTNIKKVQVNDAVYLEFSEDAFANDLPHLYDERVYYTALSSAYLATADRTTGDAATTLCPLDYAAAATAKLLCEQSLAIFEDEFYTAKLILAERDLSKFEELYGPEVKGSLEREREIRIPYYKV